jgi:hypothetical protein
MYRPLRTAKGRLEKIPYWVAFWELRSLPAGVRGPEDLCALRRFAASCAGLVVGLALPEDRLFPCPFYRRAALSTPDPTQRFKIRIARGDARAAADPRVRKERGARSRCEL